MHAKLQNLRLLNRRHILALLTLGLFLCATFAGIVNTPKAEAATSSTLNFQARLMNDDGSIVPDGNYNIEFKLYNTESAGGTAQGVCADSCLWVETRTGGNAVSVTNGYITVKLSSVSAFGSNINWDQELWLTMNIGGTGSPDWDGEMSPRLKLTAVPYAFRAGQLATRTGANTSTLGFDTQTSSNSILLPDESGVLCLQNSSNCGFVQNGAALSVGPSNVDVDGTLSVSTLGAADTGDFLCYNSSNQIAGCDTGTLGTENAENLQFKTDGVVRATFDTGNSLYLGNGVTAGNPNDFTIQGTGSTTTAVAGGSLSIQGGDATVGTANGGSVTISGGAGVGGGVLGLVKLAPTAFIASGSTQTFSSNGSVTGVDSYSTIAVSASADGLSVTVPVPDVSNQVVGRILYITAASGSDDFTLMLGGTDMQVGLKANSSATLLWNGTGWTAAGASGSTSLQSMYNNTPTSTGAAELTLNAQDSGGGLTIRNNDTNPVVGGLLEVQSATGSDLFSVNNNAVEYATNGGGEKAGASNSAFPSDTWDATTGGTVDRYNSSTDGFSPDNIAAGQNSVRVQTAANNHGARNRLSVGLTSGQTYTVSFTARAATDFSTLEVLYSPDGTTSGTTQCAAAQAVTSSAWTRITCNFVASGTITGDNAILIRQTDAVARTFYIDAMSVTSNAAASNNVQVGGSEEDGSATLLTLDQSDSAPTADDNSSYLGSMYYDTSTGTIECYEAEGWGACGAAPDNIVNLNPEYAGAVINNDGIGTMSTDFCSNGTDLTVNDTLCATGQAHNLYKWTSSELTPQTRSIYVTYQLPSNFKGFAGDDTVQLTGRVDNAADASVTYQMFKSTGSDVVQCGTDETDIIAGGGGLADTWYTYGINGDEATDCGFDETSAGNSIVFKINLKASNDASAYVSTLSFVTTNH